MPNHEDEHCEDGLHLQDDQLLDSEQFEDSSLNVYAVGVQVMLTVNLWMETGLVNSTCGIIDAILKPQDDIKTCVIMVNFPQYCSPPLTVITPMVVPITHIQNPHFTGIPLTLAWAITIHKVQGMTMKHITIDLGKKKFATGMTLVALSRVKCFDGLRIVPFDWNHYKNIQNGKHIEARRDKFHHLRALAAATAFCHECLNYCTSLSGYKHIWP